MSEKNLSIHLSFDQPVTPHEGASERILEITLKAPEGDDSAQRHPLNLGLVVDRSGSMSGSKLDYVKEASAHVANLLDDTDLVALVTFDDQVDIRFRSAPAVAGNRQELLAAIRSIRSGGQTNLGGGWLTGCQEVASSAGPGSINRTLLLTDGLANVGITNPHELSAHATALAARGVSTSTFGVGTGFNHDLLEKMANQGGGSFQFIEAVDDIPRIFEEEFKDLIQLFAREIEITLTYPSSLKVEFMGEQPTTSPEAGKLRIPLGSLAAGRSREIYVKLLIPASLDAEDLSIKATARAKGEQDRLLECSGEGVIRFATQAKADSAAKNDLVLDRFARVELAHQAAAALRLEERGQGKQAGVLLQQYLQKHHNRIDPDLERDYQEMIQRMEHGMDELDRKRSHMSTYAQKQRRMEEMTFQLLPARNLVFDVLGHPALLATGFQTSIGSRDQWLFLNRHIRLQNHFNGVSINDLQAALGTPIDFVVGMDVLHRLYVRIESPDREIMFSNEPLQAGNIHVPLTMDTHTPCAEFNIGGAIRKMSIETSLPLIYLRKEALAGLTAEGTETGFYPGVGNFNTEVYRVPFTLNGETLSLLCGVLPPQLEASFSASGIEGILGSELFNHYHVTFAFPRAYMTLERF